LNPELLEGRLSLLFIDVEEQFLEQGAFQEATPKKRGLALAEGIGYLLEEILQSAKL